MTEPTTHFYPTSGIIHAARERLWHTLALPEDIGAVKAAGFDLHTLAPDIAFESFPKVERTPAELSSILLGKVILWPSPKVLHLWIGSSFYWAESKEFYALRGYYYRDQDLTEIIACLSNGSNRPVFVPYKELRVQNNKDNKQRPDYLWAFSEPLPLHEEG